MTAAEYLRAAEALPLASLADLVGDGTLLVLAPHPDDESIGCGGLIAAAVAAGHPVRIVVLTDGAGSHPGYSGLAAQRESEARAAVARLGLPDGAIGFLGLPDGALAACDAAAVADAVLAFCPDPSAILATWPSDPHGDHTAAWKIGSEVARRRPAATLRAYPVWGWVFLYEVPGFAAPVPPTMLDEPRGWRLPIAPWLAAKREAIAAHRSQLDGLTADGFVLPDAMLRLAERPFEVFLDTEPAA